MKDRKVKRAILNTSAIFLLIIGVMIYFYLKDPTRNYLYYQIDGYKEVVVAKSDIVQGDVVTEDNVELIKVLDTELLNNRETYVTNYEELLGKKAIYPLKSGQLLPSDYFIEKGKWYEGKHEFAIEVDIPSTVANSIRIGDYVDINVSYSQGIGINELYKNKAYENFEIVIAKVMIEDIKNAEGISYENFIRQNQGTAFIPRYMKVNILYTQIDDYLGAKDKGTIFLVKYDDITAESNKVTYKDNKNHNPINSNINTTSTIDTEEETQNDDN